MSPNKSSLFSRSRMLASAGVLAIMTSGAIGAAVLSAPVAEAGAVNTADLQNAAMPSFANVVDRVKPAVVAVKVNIEQVSDNSGDSMGQMDNLPPDVQQFLKRFGGEGMNQNHVRHGMALDLGSSFRLMATSSRITTSCRTRSRSP